MSFWISPCHVEKFATPKSLRNSGSIKSSKENGWNILRENMVVRGPSETGEGAQASVAGVLLLARQWLGERGVAHGGT